MNEPSKSWATGTYSVWRQQGTVTPDTRDNRLFQTTELPLANTGGHMPIRSSLELAWLLADCPSQLRSDSVGRGQGKAALHVHLAGRFDRGEWGALVSFTTRFPYRGVEPCKCQSSIIAYFMWMVYRLISINCFWKSSKIRQGGHPLWCPAKCSSTDRLLASRRSQQSLSEGHNASRMR